MSTIKKIFSTLSPKHASGGSNSSSSSSTSSSKKHHDPHFAGNKMESLTSACRTPTSVASQSNRDEPPQVLTTKGSLDSSICYPPSKPQSRMQGKWTVQYTHSKETFTVTRVPSGPEHKSLNDASKYFLDKRSSPIQPKPSRAASPAGSTNVSLQELQFYDSLAKKALAQQRHGGGEPQVTAAVVGSASYESIFRAAAHGCLSGWHEVACPLLLYRLLVSLETKEKSLKLLMGECMRLSWLTQLEHRFYECLAKGQSPEQLYDEMQRFDFTCPWESLKEDMQHYWRVKGTTLATVTHASAVIHSMEMFQQLSAMQQVSSKARNHWKKYSDVLAQYNEMYATHSELLASREGATRAHRVQEQSYPNDGADASQRKAVEKEVTVGCQQQQGSGTGCGGGAIPPIAIASLSIDEAEEEEEELKSSLPCSTVLNRRRLNDTTITATTTAPTTVGEERHIGQQPEEPLIDIVRVPTAVPTADGSPDEDEGDDETPRSPTGAGSQQPATTVAAIRDSVGYMETADVDSSLPTPSNGSFAPSCKLDGSLSKVPGVEEDVDHRLAKCSQMISDLYSAVNRHYQEAMTAVVGRDALQQFSETEFIPMQWAEAQRSDIRQRIVSLRRKKKMAVASQWVPLPLSPISQ